MSLSPSISRSLPVSLSFPLSLYISLSIYLNFFLFIQETWTCCMNRITIVKAYSFPLPLAINIFLTIFCSSTKKARMIFSLTAMPARTPPYALDTVLYLIFFIILSKLVIFFAYLLYLIP